MPLYEEKNAADFETWPVVTTRPKGKTYGRAISILVNKLQCGPTTVDAYEDGSIDYGKVYDIPLFRDQLRSDWVMPSPKAGQVMGVVFFGDAKISDCEWLQTADSVFDKVIAVIRSLNPDMKNLLDLHGCDWEMRGKACRAKVFRGDTTPYKLNEVTGDEIPGDSVAILYRSREELILTHLFVYADGTCRIGPCGELFEITRLETLYQTGAIMNSAPPNSKIRLPGLGTFHPTEVFGDVSAHDRIAEIHDKLNILNGKPSVIITYVEAFWEYQDNPTPEGKDRLRRAYEAMPEHYREMDARRKAVRAILYGA